MPTALTWAHSSSKTDLNYLDSLQTSGQVAHDYHFTIRADKLHTIIILPQCKAENGQTWTQHNFTRMSRPSFSSDLSVLIHHDCMQLILAFCGPKELGCCANSCKTVALEVQKISIALCHYVQKTYYSNNSLILPEKLNAQYLHLITTRRVVSLVVFLLLIFFILLKLFFQMF